MQVLRKHLMVQRCHHRSLNLHLLLPSSFPPRTLPPQGLAHGVFRQQTIKTVTLPIQLPVRCTIKATARITAEKVTILT